MTAPKRKPGRPTLPPEQRQTERVEMRCTLAQREKLDLLGGPQWMRERIDKARVPKTQLRDRITRARTPKG